MLLELKWINNIEFIDLGRSFREWVKVDKR
jgi:hypothetical protein